MLVLCQILHIFVHMTEKNFSSDRLPQSGSARNALAPSRDDRTASIQLTILRLNRRVQST